MIQIQIDSQQYQAKAFAKEIKLEDVLKNIKGIEKGYIEAFFNDVAGEDGILQGTELEAFMKKLEKASGDDKNLSQQECEQFARSREKGIVGKFVMSSRASLYKEFLKQLFNTNEQKLKQEEAAKQNEPKPVTPEDKFYENGKLVKKIIHKEDGTTVEQQFKNGRLTREITKTPDGKMKDKTIDKDGNQTFHRPVKGGGEKFVIYDKNNKKIGEGKVDKNGRKHTDYLDENGKIVKSVNQETNWLDVYLYNKDGKCTERRCTSDGSTSVYKYYYDEKGNQTKEIGTYPDGTVSTRFFNENGITKEVKKEKSGRTTTTTFKDGNEYQPSRAVEVDEKGNKFITDYTYANGNAYEASKEVVRDGNGKVISTLTRKFDKEGNTAEETYTNADGSKDRVTTYKGGNPVKEQYFYKNGTTQTRTFGKNTDTEEVRDKNGNITSTRIITKNAQGDTLKEVLKDGKGQIVEITTFTANGFIVRDGSGKVLRSAEKSKTSAGQLWTDKDSSGKITDTRLHTKTGYIYTQYKDGKPLCSEEYNVDSSKSVYRNSQGEEIDEIQYKHLRKSAKLKER